MATLKGQVIQVGSGDLTSGIFTNVRSGNTTPSNSFGSDGDVWVKVAGANSDILLKKNGAWISLLGATVVVTVPDNTSNYVWLSLPMTLGRYFEIGYGATRASNYQTGNLNVVNDGSTVAALTEFGIVNVGAGTPGVTFDAQVSGSNINFLATTTSQGSSLTLSYSLKAWN
jgi:hypothetical protein